MQSVVFGPVISRRFGVSLGVDLSPSVKQCNFDCLYCELEGKKAQNQMKEVLDLETLIQSVISSLKKNPKIDVLTITANGEPTLYPYLYDFIKTIKPNLPQEVSSLILSNGSKFGDEEVQKALHLFDIVKFSLDGVDKKSFERIDRPYRDIRIEDLLSGIERFASIYKGELVAEVLLVEGINDGIENIRSIVEFLKRIEIDRVDLGTIDRPPAYDANPLSYKRLLEIAKEFEGLYVSLPYRKENVNLVHQKYSKKDLIDLIARRPISVIEASNLFEDKALSYLEEFLFDKKIFIKKVANLEFYTIKD
ncbi:radical SAM protein [Helicobacter sp. 13S00477-4]|uniref:radical SAM protein n=1 Tax=Helicobacter sp. 13S00477-4 TaxID=1905759 RepID=UPI000BA51DDA|nr:radical SAM protein [Helicobacter sp. 13S00477-4]PAF51526.1 hypothetical protein BKH44_05645 [Helicobacter sp. 13S00477-4]